MIKEAVLVTIQEEVDIVYKTLNRNPYNRMIQEHGACIIYLNPNSGFDKIISIKNHKIHTFEEWCKINNINQITNKTSMIEQMKNVLSMTYDNPILRRTTVPLFMSNPGMGKSTMVEEFAKSRGVHMLSTILSTRMPNEVAGGVMPNGETKCWEVYDNYDLASLKDGDIWFIDECFNGVLKQTLDALLNVIEGRRLPSGKKLADVMIIAASNPQGLINLTPQIKQRFIRYNLKFNSEEFENYLKNKYGMPESISKNISIAINKEKFEPESWDFITPRSMEKAINQIGCNLENPYDDLLMPFLTKEIEAPIDITSLNVKKGENIEYLKLLKLFIQKNNQEALNLKVQGIETTSKTTSKKLVES